MAGIDITGLAKRLEKRMDKVGAKALKTYAVKLLSRIRAQAVDWKKEIRAIMSKPSISRGKTKGKLNLHSSFSMNQGFPMMDKGSLRASLHYRITERYSKNKVVINISALFKPLAGRDYGSILNGDSQYEGHHILKEFKERAYSKLDQRIKTIVSKGGFA